MAYNKLVMVNKNITNQLRIISQFKNLRMEEIKAISQVCILLPFEKGEIIFTEGDKANSVYLLIEGYVEIWKDFHNVKKDMLARQNKGHIVGEMAVIDELTRSATVIAGEKMITYSIKRRYSSPKILKTLRFLKMGCDRDGRAPFIIE